MFRYSSLSFGPSPHGRGNGTFSGTSNQHLAFRRFVSWPGSNLSLAARNFDFDLSPLAVARAVRRTVGNRILLAEFLDDLAKRIAQRLAARRIDVTPATLLGQISQNSGGQNIFGRALLAHVHGKDRGVRAQSMIERFIRTRATIIFARTPRSLP